MKRSGNYKPVSAFYPESYQFFESQSSLNNVATDVKPNTKGAKVLSKNENSASLKMEWKNVENNNTSEPSVWGSAFWFSLHNGASKYPINASPIFAEKMKGFILGMPYILPCENCSEHARSYINKRFHQIDEITSGREKLFTFFVNMHNVVNKRYGKKEITVEDAYKLYTSNKVNIQKLSYA
jgi:hypothetical protein